MRVPMHESSTDHDLMAQVRHGSEAALAQIYDRHATTVYRAAFRLHADAGFAEEVVQETFLALWNRAEQFDSERGSLAAWLTVIARNRAIDRRRAAARRLHAEPFATVVGDLPDPVATVDWLMTSGTPVALGSPEPGPDAMVATGETRAVLARAIGALADEERLAIVLAYREGLSQSEIADRLGWPLGTVKTRSRRALRRLRDELDAAEAPAPPARGPGQRASRATRPDRPGSASLAASS